MAAAENNGPLASGQERDAERAALQRKRSIAIAVSLGLLVVLFYIATLVKMGGAGTTPQPENSGKSGQSSKTEQPAKPGGVKR